MKRDDPEPQRKKREQNILVDDFDKDVIRRTLQDLIVSKKQVPNVSLLKDELKQRIGFSGGRETLRKILHDVGFKWKKTQSNRNHLMERTDIVAARVQYLRKIRKMRDAGRTIVYTDETFYTLPTVCTARGSQSRLL